MRRLTDTRSIGSRFRRAPWRPRILLPLLLLTTFSYAGETLKRYVFSEPHMGTLMQITLFAEDEENAAAAAEAAFQRIEELNSILSDYDSESELMRLARHPAGTAVEVSDDLFEVLFRAQEVAVATEGVFDVTSGPLVRLWREARRQEALPDKAAIREAKAVVCHRNVRLDAAGKTVTLLAPGMQIDLGGIAKGYAADEALKVLRDRGVSRALVAAAGDIAAGDPPPASDGWRIGIASLDTGEAGARRTILLQNRAVSTSGDTEQFVEIDGVRYSHIVNPGTGVGLTTRIGVTVVAADATAADSLSTAVSIMGSDKGLALIESIPGTEALIQTEGPAGTETVASSGFAGE